MKKLILIPLLAILMLGIVYAKPPASLYKGGVEGHLWLNISGCVYIGDDPDPWIEDSCVTTDTIFDLTVSNQDKNEDSYNTTLLISLNNGPSLITVIIDNNTITGYVNGTPPYQGIGPHGVWPTSFAEYNIGFLAMDGGSKTVHVNITLSSGDDMVHFDAVGFDVDGNLILKSPFSHDVTALPEFTTIGALMVLAGAGAYALRRRRK